MQPANYQIIYADPPWLYNDKCNAGQRGAEFKYSCMGLDALCQLPVASLAAPNCVLFMWVTAPTLPDALTLGKAWGFRYKTKGFCWVKTNKDGSIYKGMGHYTRSNTEDCLIFTNGKLPARQDKGISQVIMAPRREHSRKPDEAHKRIEQLYGDLPRIELFARTQVPGWDAWGNQTTKFEQVG